MRRGLLKEGAPCLHAPLVLLWRATDVGFSMRVLHSATAIACDPGPSLGTTLLLTQMLTQPIQL